MKLRGRARGYRQGTSHRLARGLFGRMRPPLPPPRSSARPCSRYVDKAPLVLYNIPSSISSMAKKKTVALLFGGRSAEHEVSIRSAAAIFDNLDPAKFRVGSIFINKQGRWKKVASPLVPAGHSGAVHSGISCPGAVRGLPPPRRHLFPGPSRPLRRGRDDPGPPGNGRRPLRRRGRARLGGGDGQGGDESPVPGERTARSSSISSSWKRTWRSRPAAIFEIRPAGISSPSIRQARESRIERGHHQGKDAFPGGGRRREGFPLRPENPCRGRNPRPRARMQRPRQRRPRSVASRRGDAGTTSSMIIATNTSTAKRDSASPPTSRRPSIREVRRLAVEAFKACDAAGMARVDFFSSGHEQGSLNEINTIPGFTEISMYPKLWEVSGLPFPGLSSASSNSGSSGTARKKGASSVTDHEDSRRRFRGPEHRAGPERCPRPHRSAAGDIPPVIDDDAEDRRVFPGSRQRKQAIERDRRRISSAHGRNVGDASRKDARISPIGSKKPSASPSCSGTSA